MNKEKGLLMFMMLLVAGLLGWRWYQHRHIVFAYRLTAEVDVNGAHYTGSGVVETRWRRAPALDTAETGDWLSYVQGEAIPIELGPYGTLLITLGRMPQQSPGMLPGAVFGWSRFGEGFEKYLRELVDSRETQEILPKNMPFMLYFKDPANPDTAECLDTVSDADARLKEFKAHFVGASLTMVHEPFTTGLERLLPWIASPAKFFKDRRFMPLMDSSGHPIFEKCRIEMTDFKRGTL